MAVITSIIISPSKILSRFFQNAFYSHVARAKPKQKRDYYTLMGGCKTDFLMQS